MIKKKNSANTLFWSYELIRPCNKFMSSIKLDGLEYVGEARYFFCRDTSEYEMALFITCPETHNFSNEYMYYIFDENILFFSFM